MKYEQKNGWELIEDIEKNKIFDFCESYKKYLDEGKTERLCVNYTIKLAEKNGFVPFDENKKLVAGDKVYINSNDK